LDATQRDRAVDALTQAFIDDPMWSCIVPDREARHVVLRPMWDALIGYARIYGQVLSTPDAQGVACWIAPGKTKTTIWRLLRTGMGLPRSMLHLPKDARARFMRTMRFVDEGHKTLMTERHWYLMALGVAPESQGRGLGTALLAPILDRNDVACYLETQTEENVAFYRKRGFEVIREAAEPVCDLPIWFLRRNPQHAADVVSATGSPATDSR
jgi:ribosomal protein S18 acetylase RimI-like enzyme